MKISEEDLSIFSVVKGRE